MRVELFDDCIKYYSENQFKNSAKNMNRKAVLIVICLKGRKCHSIIYIYIFGRIPRKKSIKCLIMDNKIHSWND